MYAPLIDAAAAPFTLKEDPIIAFPGIDGAVDELTTDPTPFQSPPAAPVPPVLPELELLSVVLPPQLPPPLPPAPPEPAIDPLRLL